MRFAFVPFTVLAASLTFAGTPSANMDPSMDYFKIDMTRPPPQPTPVYIVNWPETQAVSGTVSVDNLPAVQTVGGTVNIGNLPAMQTVLGNVAVSNLPLGADGALRVSSPSGKFIGVTTTAVLGNAGWRDLNLACNSQFGATYASARMCMSKDILNTPVTQWPSLPGNAWVQPVIIAATSWNSSERAGGFVDMSGVTEGNARLLSCNAWSGTVYGETPFGLVLKSNGGFGTVYCLDATTFVTCCADGTP